ncbi:alpha/beta fold hydrolase [Aeoliella mucimassa]|uniref:Poly-beta-hydroxybutyrate polymerase n=1 Tax=Aeoliella mucimassa TaxID=2527972 RepID=A0A518AQ37_9BACT|nr:alpha/beta fold hydrolase [Aeoliella mucimassa]QDU56839.1 Poly-beta-hydroxybutyrate polymerase [Aeoliella mucimassa]
MSATTDSECSVQETISFADVCAEWHKTFERAQRFNRFLTTDAKIAQTPKQLVWTLNKAKLYRYVSPVPANERKPVPLLMVFAIMNRPHVLDLRPGHSFVEYMLAEGYDLFLLDWGAPGPEDQQMQFDDYALEYLPRVVRKVKALSGSAEFSMLGWCLGALISTLYAALRPNEGLKNLILLTAPLDFSDKTQGGFTRWSSDPAFNADMIVEKFGNVPGEMIDSGAKMLKPVENYVGSYTMLWDNLDNDAATEAWHAMNTWVRDIIPMAGNAYKQLINDFYKENRLMEDALVIRGEPVHLSDIRASLLNVIAESDHITPPCQSERIMDMVSSGDKEVLRVRGGHIGIMAGRGAEKSTWPHIESWLASRSA